MPLLLDPPNRRDFLKGAAATGLAGALKPGTAAAEEAGPQTGDRVILCNEDSNTLSVIDPVTNTIAGTVNLTSFEADPRPPFRFDTGGVAPTHAAMRLLDLINASA